MIKCNLKNNVDWMDLVQVRLQWSNLAKEVIKRLCSSKLVHFSIKSMASEPF